MKITVLTLFPNLFTPVLATSILDRAKSIGAVSYQLVDIRNFGQGSHKSVDDRPYGGGPGMILRVDVLAQALKSVLSKIDGQKEKTAVVLTSASGKPFKQKVAQQLSQLDNLIIICGHYEGVDQRFSDLFVDHEISIGDYILTGGEIPALVILDSVVRLLPNVLKKEAAIIDESFSKNCLEYPQYTRPETFQGRVVPQVLRSGDHQKINSWRSKKSISKTKQVRPDLLKG